MKAIKLLILAPLVLSGVACSDSDSDGTGSNGNAGDGTLTMQSGTGESSPVTDGTEGSVTDGSNTTGSPGPDSGAGGGSASGNVVSIGFLNALYDPLDDVTEWNAQFLRGTSAFPLSSLGDELPGISSVDQCQLIESAIPDTDLDTDIDLENLPFVPDPVSAGDVITLTAPSGTYASLTSQTAFGFLFYQTPDDVPVAGTIPSGLTADIPGSAGGFPAFSGVAFPTAAPIEISIDGSSLSWTGSGEAGATVNFLFSILADSDILGQTFIECDLQDDGAHTLAAELLPAGNLLEYPFFIGTRTVSRIEQNGDAALILVAESEGFLVRN